MIVFRHADPRFPFLWESPDQPSARWHRVGEGPAHYLAETADGAWAEFLRHEAITDPEDLAGVARSIWAIELPETPDERPVLDEKTLTGGERTYAACQLEARRLRDAGADGLTAPSAALRSPASSGFRTEGGLVPGPARDERVFVLFGPRPDLIAWAACAEGRPREDLLPRVRRLR
ncbi:MAG: RES domain-containing protein [Chloroflexi bacterium]|nr:RES domain-containing protein [Chloroflexota bacterium]